MEKTINDNHLKKFCKIGQGVECCRYVMVGKNGFECLKNIPKAKKLIDEQIKNRSDFPKGDNCNGYEVETNKKN
jgi:hypothetical protein